MLGEQYRVLGNRGAIGQSLQDGDQVADRDPFPQQVPHDLLDNP